MKKNKAGDVFIIVLIIISLALIIGYIVINNISIMENNLLYTDNSNKLSKNLEEKANINFEAIFPNQNILSIVPEKAQSYNIFWNNYMTREIIEQNSGALNKLGNVENGQLFLNLSSNSPLNYKLKVIKFDKDEYEFKNTLIPIEISESIALTSTGGYIQINNGIVSIDVSNGYDFNFKNNDYAIFIENNGDSSIQVNLEGYVAGESIFLNAINETNYPNIYIITNHIIQNDTSYIGDNKKLSFNVYDGEIGVVKGFQSYYGGINCDDGNNYMANQTWKNIIVRNGNGSGFTIMDRNLGAVNAYTGNENSSVQGNYYQWGNNYGFSSSETLSDTSTGQVSTLDNGPGNYYFSSTFIYGNNNWSSNQNNNLWGGEGDTLTSNGTGTNINRQGPCADGYHVPSTLEWHGLFQAWCKYRGGTNCVVSDWNSLSWSSLGGNATFTNFQSDLKLPFAGYRNWEAGSVYSQGTEGLYWSSSSSASVYYLHFNSSEIYPQYGNYHAYGMSARCFRN